MGKIRRYKFFLDGPFHFEDEEGEWVRWADVCNLCKGVGVHSVDEYYKEEGEGGVKLEKLAPL